MSDQFFDNAQRMQAVIKQALLKEWDPIGVGAIPEAKEEYDSYVPKIYEMLIQRKTKQEMFDYLWWVETEQMGLTGNRQATSIFVDRLLSIVSGSPDSGAKRAT